MKREAMLGLAGFAGLTLGAGIAWAVDPETGSPINHVRLALGNSNALLADWHNRTGRPIPEIVEKRSTPFAVKDIIPNLRTAGFEGHSPYVVACLIQSETSGRNCFNYNVGFRIWIPTVDTGKPGFLTVDDGKAQVFRAFNNLADGLSDYHRLLSTGYPAALVHAEAGNVRAFQQALGSRYSPTYAREPERLMDMFRTLKRQGMSPGFDPENMR